MKTRTSLFCLAAIGIAVAAAAQPKLPHPDHIVIVIEENKGFTDVIGSKKAPFINSLAKAGANLTNYHGLHHPSQPNYLELFSGSNQGVCNDTCPPSSALFNAPNLAGSLMAANRTFAGFADGLPVGLMVTGRLYDEATVLAVAAAYERGRGPIDDRPRLTLATTAGNGARARRHQ